MTCICYKCLHVHEKNRQGSMRKMLAIGNRELDGNPDIGATAECPNCKTQHAVEYGKSRSMNPDGTWTELVESKVLAYVKCPTNEKVYLVGLNGKSLASPPKIAPYKGCCGE